MSRFSQRFSLLTLICITIAGCGGDDSPSAATAQSVASPSTTTTSASIKAQTISGTISGGGGATVSLAGTATSTVADSAGNYQLSADDAVTYTIVPAKSGYVFTPASLTATPNGASVSEADFIASANSATTYTLSGHVSGAMASGVTITLNGVDVGATATDASGNYSFSGLVSGTYSVSAAASGYAFSPALLVTLGTVDSTTNDFTDTAAGTAALAFSPLNPLPQATVGAAYSNTVVGSMSGGTGPYHYQTDSLAMGVPPLGMVLNPNGNLTGTAQTTGTYTFGVCVVDAAGNSIAPCDTTSITVIATPPATPAPAAPTVSLTANPPSITSGASSTLTWSTTEATSCTGGGALSGGLATAGQLAVSPTATTTYSLTCSGTGGSASSSIKITVTAAAAPAPSVTLSANPTSITAGASSTLTWSSSNATSCTANGAWSGNQNTSGSLSITPTANATYTLTCQNSSGGSAHASQSITVTPASTAQVQATPTTSWVYYNGQFDWPGSYSFGVTLNYNDTSGGPLSGNKDLQVSLTGQWGGWQPYAQNSNFNSQPYTKLTISLKPTVANQLWKIYFEKVGDIPVGVTVNPLNYGPAPVVGQWGTYVIPLSDLGVQGLDIYKFCIQDQTGLYSNTWYVDNVGFVP